MPASPDTDTQVFPAQPRPHELCPGVTIDKQGVRIGDTVLGTGGHPAHIAENGISINLGSSRDFNRLTVTFIVGEIRVLPTAADQVRIERASES